MNVPSSLESTIQSFIFVIMLISKETTSAITSTSACSWVDFLKSLFVTTLRCMVSMLAIDKVVTSNFKGRILDLV